MVKNNSYLALSLVLEELSFIHSNRDPRELKRALAVQMVLQDHLLQDPRHFASFCWLHQQVETAVPGARLVD